MPSNNLEPGQYQLGDFVFGFGTLFTVENFDIGGYDVTVQDYQAQLSDETRFGSDSLKSLPIQLIVNAFENRALPNVVALTGDATELNFDSDPTVGQFTREWRADDIRKNWGSLKPLYICRKDGRVVQVYGRPGKCQVSRPDRENARKITAEFRRSDTLCYTDFEWFTQVRDGEEITVWRSSEMEQGDAPCWVRFFLVGPMNNPTITFGDLQIVLNYELEYGDIVEISSYPWERRAIRLNDGLSLNAYVTQPYLEKIIFDIDKPVQLRFDATDTNKQIEEEDFATYTPTTEGLDTSGKWSTSQYSTGTGKWRIQSGKLVWDDSGNQTRTVSAIYTDAQTITPYQTVGFTTDHPAEEALGGGEPTNRIIGRSNASGTEYYYWDISYTTAWFGYHKPDGTERILKEFELRKPIRILRRILNNFTTIFGGSGNPSDGWQYDADFGTGQHILGSNLHINNVKVLTFDPTPKKHLNIQSSSTSPIYDPFIDLPHLTENKYTGIGMRANFRNLGQSTPAGLTEFHMRDNPVVPLNVSSVYMMWRDAWQNI